MKATNAPAARTLLVLLLALATWAGGVARGGFALDDREVLFDNPVVEGGAPWSALWTRDYWSHSPAGAAGHYRPLATASLRLDRACWGASPVGYHVTNLALHLLVVAAAARLLVALARDGAGVGVGWGLALFAAHPALADSVVWISGRTSMLSALGGLVGVLLLERATRASRPSSARTLGAFLGAAAAALLGGLGKEDGVVFGLAAVLLARARRRGLPAALGAAAAVGLLLALRHVALGSLDLAMPQAPLAAEPVATRLRFGGAALARALEVAAVPLDVPPALGRQHLAPLAGAPGALAGVALALALLGGAARARRGASRGARLAGASLLLAAAALVPWSQLVPLGELFAPRMLYLPLLLGAPAFDALAARVLAHAPRARRALPVAAALAAIVLGWSAAGTYASRASYWRARLAHEPDSARAWNALGNARAEAGNAAGAERAWRRALALEPSYSRPWTNLGGALLAQGRVTEAEGLLERAVRAGPRNPVAWANLGNLRLRTAAFAEAARAYERAAELSPGAVAIWRGLARARRGAGDGPGARAALERALALDPRDARARELERRWRDADPPLYDARERP